MFVWTPPPVLADGGFCRTILGYCLQQPQRDDTYHGSPGRRADCRIESSEAGAGGVCFAASRLRNAFPASLIPHPNVWTTAEGSRLARTPCSAPGYHFPH